MTKWYTIREDGMDIFVEKADTKEEAVAMILFVHNAMYSPYQRRELKRNGFKSPDGGQVLYAALSEYDQEDDAFWDGFTDIVDIKDVLRIEEEEE